MNRNGPEIKAIFLGALDRPAAERADYLAGACSQNPELRQRIDALLLAHGQVGEIFGTLADGATTASEATLTLGGGNGEGLPAGATVRYFGDYEIQSELGRGGMGVVYQARQVSLNRPVALKMLKAGLLAGEDESRRFQNEAEAVALLDHPGIVPVYEVGEHDGHRYLSMKLILGGNLADQLDRFQADPRAAATLLAEIAEALHHAHIRGILHRDLKPANILLDADGHPQITDFGLAKRIEEDAGLTLSGAILGTPAYMAPEQATGGRRGTITTATDVYGLGSILYALLTGKAPFVSNSVVETLQQVRDQPPESPRKSNPKIARDLEVICLKCLEKDPRRRYAGAQAVADDLKAWLESRPITARPVGPLERATLYLRRKPVLATVYGLSAAVLLLLAFGGSLAWLWRDAERARAEAIVARDDEKQARNEVEKTRETLAAVEYGRTIQVAYQEYRDNNVAATRALLKGTRPDLRGWEWRYVDRLCHLDLLTIPSEELSLESAEFSPDGSKILVGDDKPTIRDARTGAVLIRLEGYCGASFSPDGSRVVTGSLETGAKVWDAHTGVQLLAFGGPSSVRWPEYSRDGSKIVATTGNDINIVKVWDAKTGVQLLLLEGSPEAICRASLSPDGARIVMSNFEETTKIQDTRTGVELLALKSHGLVIFSASFNADGSKIVTGCSDDTARIWDARTGDDILTLRGHADAVHTAAFSPDGSKVVTTSPDKTVRIWDAQTGTELLTLRGHTGDIRSALFSPDGSRVISASFDGTVKIWDARTNFEALTIKRSLDEPIASSFSPDGSRIVSGDGDELAIVYDARMGGELFKLSGHDEALTSVSYSRDGSKILTSSDDKTARVWDAHSGSEILVLRGHAERVNWATFSPDGSRIATVSDDGTTKVWDAHSGLEILVLRGHAARNHWATFSPDGSRIATLCDGTTKVWDARSGTEIFLIPRKKIRSIAFSPDGSRIVTGGISGNPTVWDATTGAELLTLRVSTDAELSKGSGKAVWSISFSPDGSRILAGCDEHTASVWDAMTGARLLDLKGSTEDIGSIEKTRWSSFSPDGSRIISSDDGMIKLWDARSGAEVLTLKGSRSGVPSASFSLDGSRIISSGRSGQIRVWDARPIRSDLAPIKNDMPPNSQTSSDTAGRSSPDR